MISFEVDSCYILDLKDDFIVNETLTLYEFIGKDPVKAFYLGININKWFKDIDMKQQYLYSKQARHNKDGIEKYFSQIDYWSKKFSDQEEVDITELAEYIMNNMFWDKGTEDIDKIKLAFFFGNTIALQQKNE